MINGIECAKIFGISSARLGQILKEDPEKYQHEKSHKGTKIPHKTVRKLMSERGVAYHHTKMMFACEKGGVGKTSLTCMFAVYAAKMGLNVLVVDLDPEANSSQFLTKEVHDWKSVKTIREVFEDKKQIIDYVVESKFEGIDFLWSNTMARRVNATTEGKNPKTILPSVLKGVEKMYDLVLFDVPPTFTKLVASAYISADTCVMPVEPSLFSLESVELTIMDVEEICEEYEAVMPKFKILKNKLTTNRTASKDIEEELGRSYGHLLLNYSLKDTAHIQNSVNMRADPLEMKGCPGHLRETINDLFEEFIKRQ